MIVKLKVRWPDQRSTQGKIVLERDDPQFGHISSIVFENYDHNKTVGAVDAIRQALRFVGYTVEEGRLY